MESVLIDDKEYEVIKNYRDALNVEDLEGKITDYFDNFDYILGDYAYNKLRLKGFYEDSNKKSTAVNKFSYIDEYIEKYCAYECRYFILKKKI